VQRNDERLNIPLKEIKMPVISVPLISSAEEKVISKVRKKRKPMNTDLQTVNARIFFLDEDVSNNTLGLRDTSYSVLRINGENKVSKTFKYTTVFVSDKKIEINKLLDTNAKIVLAYDQKKSSSREIYGKIHKVKELSRVLNKHLYEIDLVSPFYYLSLNKRYEIYQEMKVPEIITSILNRYSSLLNISNETKLDLNAFPLREYCTQHNQSDLEFITMLCEEEKISLLYEDNEQEAKVVLSNINEHPSVYSKTIEASYNLEKKFSPTLQNEVFYDYETPSTPNIVEKGESIDELSLEENSASSQLRADIKVYSLRDRLELMEGSRYSDLERYSKLNIKQDYAQAERITGKTQDIFLKDSLLVNIFESKNHKEVESIIIQTSLKAYFPNAIDELVDEQEEYAFDIEFTAISSKTIYIPVLETIKPEIKGVQTALVACGKTDTTEDINTIDVDDKGRIRVIFHFDENRPTSCFIRISTLYAGDNWGSQFFPRVNTEVIVSFINGNIDKPVIIGNLYNGNNQIPQDPQANRTQSYIKTNSLPQYEDVQGYNELLFEDKQYNELLSLRAQKDYKLHALHNSYKNIDNDQSEVIGNDEDILVKNDRATEVLNDNSLIIGGNNTQLVKQNKMETIAIAKALSIGAGYQVTVGGAKNETVGMSSTEQVGILKHMLVGKRFELSVGASKLVLNSDGSIILSGKNISINGSSKVEINAASVEIN